MDNNFSKIIHENKEKDFSTTTKDVETYGFYPYDTQLLLDYYIFSIENDGIFAKTNGKDRIEAFKSLSEKEKELVAMMMQYQKIVKIFEACSIIKDDDYEMLPNLHKRKMFNLGKCSEEYLNADAYLQNPQILRNIFAHKYFDIFINSNKEIMITGSQWKKGKEDLVSFSFSMEQMNNLSHELYLATKDNDEFFHKKMKLHSNKSYNALYTCLVSKYYLYLSDRISRVSDDEISKKIDGFKQEHKDDYAAQLKFERGLKSSAQVKRDCIRGTILYDFIAKLLLEKTKEGKKKIALYDKENKTVKEFNSRRDITYQDFLLAVRAIRNGVLHKNISIYYERDGKERFEIFDYAYTGKKWLKCKEDREFLSKHEMNLSGKELLTFAKIILHFENDYEKVLERVKEQEKQHRDRIYEEEREM